jgi:hypothetical protein
MADNRHLQSCTDAPGNPLHIGGGGEEAAADFAELERSDTRGKQARARQHHFPEKSTSLQAVSLPATDNGHLRAYCG